MVNVIKAFLRGLDKPIILWLLAEKPIHGYGLIKELKRITGRKPTSSIIYPFLHRLEERGFAVGRWVEKYGRNVKYYSLTEKGLELLNNIYSLFQKPVKEVLRDFLLKERGAS